ncbi:MAG TPA: hypothetical protein VLG09_01895 [Candidatus Saccharimonadales bacterium]|nr:hypothetical protein [Candidatus Saccharimonadales bacterium]
MVEIPDEEAMILFDLIDAIELDDTAPEELKKKLADAVQVRNSYGPEGQQAASTVDQGVAAPA